jgi:hypothetical protein
VTSKGRSKKRHGRPGAAAASRAKSPPKASRTPSALEPHAPDHAAGAEVKPDRVPSAQQWAVSTWLMLASTLWSLIVVWQLLTSGDDPAFSGEGPPWLLTLAAVTCAVASVMAFQFLRKGLTARARTPILIAAVTGVFAVFSTVVSLVSLWLVKRANRGPATPSPSVAGRR